MGAKAILAAEVIPLNRWHNNACPRPRSNNLFAEAATASASRSCPQGDDENRLPGEV
jgi:hypothetical protein